MQPPLAIQPGFPVEGVIGDGAEALLLGLQRLARAFDLGALGRPDAVGAAHDQKQNGVESGKHSQHQDGEAQEIGVQTPHGRSDVGVEAQAPDHDSRFGLERQAGFRHPAVGDNALAVRHGPPAVQPRPGNTLPQGLAQAGFLDEVAAHLVTDGGIERPPLLVVDPHPENGKP